jgi:hypothetical protein
LAANRRLPKEVMLRDICDEIDFLGEVPEGRQQVVQGRLTLLEQAERIANEDLAAFIHFIARDNPPFGSAQTTDSSFL